MQPIMINSRRPETSGNIPSERHPLYSMHYHSVKMVNDVYNGADNCREYIFKFPQEAKETYDDRCNRATLRNFVKRAVEAFIGMIFRKPLLVDGYPARMTKIFDRIDTVDNITEFSKRVAERVTKDGKTFVLIDSPVAGADTNVTHPYMNIIDRSQLINWRKDELGRFTMVVIEEILQVPHGDFGSRYVYQWRHYTDDGVVKIYRIKDDVRHDNRVLPSNYVASRSEQDFYLHTSVQSDYKGVPVVEVSVADIPVLYDVAQMNLKHFNRQSHKDRYLTMAAMPIPVIWGADVDDDGATTHAKPAIVLGVDEAFVFTGTKEESDFQWRELSGDSIDLLEKDLDSITEDITTGILRAADSANAVQKTATEVALLQAEASNRVTSIAMAVNTGMRKALEILAVFTNETVSNKAIYELSSDFNAMLAGTDGARVIFESYLAGLISIDTYLETLSEMELITISSAKEELIRIKADKFKPTSKVEEKPSGNSNVDPLAKTDNRTKNKLNN